MQTWLLWYSKDAEVCFKLLRIFQIFDIFLLFPGVIIFLAPPQKKKKKLCAKSYYNRLKKWHSYI